MHGVAVENLGAKRLVNRGPHGVSLLSRGPQSLGFRELGFSWPLADWQVSDIKSYLQTLRNSAGNSAHALTHNRFG